MMGRNTTQNVRFEEDFGVNYILVVINYEKIKFKKTFLSTVKSKGFGKGNIALEMLACFSSRFSPLLFPRSLTRL